MADRFPIIIDIADGNKLKELPAGDNLNLENSGIVRAESIQTGIVNTVALQVDGRTLNEIAFTGDYDDLIANVPSGFSGEYADLKNTPDIPTSTRRLDDVYDVEPQEGEFLVYNSITGLWEPKLVDFPNDIPKSLNDLNDVVLTGNLNTKFLKNTGGAWNPVNIIWTDITDRPLNVSQFINDSNYLNPNSLDSYINPDDTISYSNGEIGVSINSISAQYLSVSSNGEIGDSLHSAEDGTFEWRNRYKEQEIQPQDPLPGDEWFDNANKIYYKYLGTHWIALTEFNVVATEDGIEIQTESGDAIDFS